MQEVTEYLVRARQCREMIERALPGQRQALEELALTWEKLQNPEAFRPIGLTALWS